MERYHEYAEKRFTDNARQYAWAMEMSADEADTAGRNGWIDYPVWEDWHNAHYWFTVGGFKVRK